MILGSLKQDDKVNLERAMRADNRFGGHFVQVGDIICLASSLLSPFLETDAPFENNHPKLQQGHVDRTAQIKSIEADGDSLRLRFKLSTNGDLNHEGLPLASLLIPKGYITLDGISLTLCSVSDGSEFEVMLIKHTQLHVTLSKKIIGDEVNVEFDCLTKSIARTLIGSLTSLVDQAVERALSSRKHPTA